MLKSYVIERGTISMLGPQGLSTIMGESVGPSDRIPCGEAAVEVASQDQPTPRGQGIQSSIQRRPKGSSGLHITTSVASVLIASQNIQIPGGQMQPYMNKPARKNGSMTQLVPPTKEFRDNDQNSGTSTLIGATVNKQPPVTFPGRVKRPAGFGKNVHSS